MKRFAKWTCLAVAGWLVAQPAFAGAQTENEFDNSLDILLLSPVSVASVTKSTLRESPGIVTVVTAEEIDNSGARDLIDVLRLVPGFDFGVDVEGNVSVGIRGNWANEGKVSLLWDGQEFTEPLYSTLQFGNHFPVDQITRIEIIRGPGSVIYGGNAELAVINIVTKGAKELNGFAASAIYGQMEKTYGRRDLSLAYGKQLDPDFGFSASAFLGQGNRSDRTFTDNLGGSYDMAENSRLDPLNLEAKLNCHGFNGLILFDHRHTTERDEAGQPIPAAANVDFTSFFMDLSYAWRLSQDMTLTPRFNFKRQDPWQEPVPDPSVTPYNKTVQRYTGSLQFAYDALQNLNLLAGLEAYRDHAVDYTPVETGGFDNLGSPEIYYSNLAAYAQGILNTSLVDATAGVRYENHSDYGSSFVPRLALTKILDRFHFKILASKAFRAPSIENIKLNPDIKPESDVDLEAEMGYQLTHSMIATVNVFDNTLSQPIIYDTNSVGDELYMNEDKVRTQGLEVVYRWQETLFYATLSYSYYRNVENHVALYVVPDHDALLLAFPAHKITFNSSFTLVGGLRLNPSAIWTSERYAYATPDGLGDNGLLLNHFDPVLLANLYLNYRNAFVQGLELGVGVYNLLNAEDNFPQPYNGGHAPLPGPSREWIVKASYSF